MTLVELFDKNPVENIISSLVLQPQRVIFVGRKEIMAGHKRIIEKLFNERRLKTDIHFLHPDRNSLDCAVELLSEIQKKFPDCEFDLTGGDDLMLLAMGVLMEKSPTKPKVHRYFISDRSIVGIDIDGSETRKTPFYLSVGETINLYGGSVLKSFKYESRWDMPEDFKDDTDKMWGLCRKDTGLWNRLTGVLADFEHMKEKRDSLETVLSLSEIRSHLSNKNQSFDAVEKFLQNLCSLKLIQDTGSDNAFLRYRFKNELIRHCLVKAGTVLELKILMIARGIRDEKDEPFFNDALQGVNIDWDGKRHSSPFIAETENEVDVILMRGHIPIFISCKNGFTDDEELYKLNTVAEKFGGPYVKKVLIATKLTGRNRSLEYFRQRAKDMGITLIENAHLMNDEDLAEKIKGL